ncbi:hypothetical protein CDAR_282421 [Caerostris darwini]|uniref:Uncharacterized protein n=1 Tax=Caerostris darwini TaxID=1538125 RepID=A0AAV4MPD0_9ARAC|nr:hypothetical protein CDAR_282421 [Caerostris darwini]
MRDISLNLSQISEVYRSYPDIFTSLILPPVKKPTHTIQPPPLTRCHDSKNIPSHSSLKQEDNKTLQEMRFNMTSLINYPQHRCQRCWVPLHCTHCEGWRGGECFGGCWRHLRMRIRFGLESVPVTLLFCRIMYRQSS